MSLLFKSASSASFRIFSLSVFFAQLKNGNPLMFLAILALEDITILDRGPMPFSHSLSLLIKSSSFILLSSFDFFYFVTKPRGLFKLLKLYSLLDAFL